MKCIKTLTLLLILFFTQQLFSHGENENFEFSGIEQFWDIVSTLEENQEPTNSEWNNLFNTPGYKVLISGEFTKDFFKQNFRLVFMPSQKKNLETNLQNRSHLHHYIKVRDNKLKIQEQLRKLKRGNYNRKAVKRTLKFLPQRSVEQYPPVSFVIFESNGRGSSPLVVDLEATLEWDFMSFLSHEYHHWYRNKQLIFDNRSISFDDRIIVNTLSMIEAEGIADMVDKKAWFTKPSNAISKYARHFINDVGRTPYIIKSMDRIFSKIENNPKNKNSLSRSLEALLPQKGHTTGYFMASLILKNLGKKELVKCVGNPFNFFFFYNKATKCNGNIYPGFSNQAIKFIESLSKKYSK